VRNATVFNEELGIELRRNGRDHEVTRKLTKTSLFEMMTHVLEVIVKVYPIIC